MRARDRRIVADLVVASLCGDISRHRTSGTASAHLFVNDICQALCLPPVKVGPGMPKFSEEARAYALVLFNEALREIRSVWQYLEDHPRPALLKDLLKMQGYPG